MPLPPPLYDVPLETVVEVLQVVVSSDNNSWFKIRLDRVRNYREYNPSGFSCIVYLLVFLFCNIPGSAAQITYQDSDGSTTVTIPAGAIQNYFSINGFAFDGSSYSSSGNQKSEPQSFTFANSDLMCVNATGSFSCHKTYTFNCAYKTGFSNALCNVDNHITFTWFLGIVITIFVVIKCYQTILRTVVAIFACIASLRKGRLLVDAHKLFANGLTVKPLPDKGISLKQGSDADSRFTSTQHRNSMPVHTPDDASLYDDADTEADVDTSRLMIEY